MTDDPAIERLLEVFRELEPEVANAGGPDNALKVITTRSLTAVDGAEHCSITRARPGGFETVAPTSDIALRVDAIQYELESGPCIDAAITDSVFRTDDLRIDPRWPEFGRRAGDIGIVSMLAFRMYFEDEDYIAALNLYSPAPAAFSDEARLAGLAVTTYGALAITSARRHDRIINLERALASNRDIGVAIGVLMALHRVTREQAFDLSRVASQGRHRKLADVAHDVAETGSLDVA